MKEKDKTIISIQIPDFVVQQLKDKAKEECTSVSYLIRKLIIKWLREEDNNSGNR